MTRVAAFLACLALLAPAAAQAAPTTGTTTTPQTTTSAAKKKAPFVTDQKTATTPAKPAAKPAPPPGAPGASTSSFWDDFTNFALTWLPTIFMGLIVLLIGLTMRSLPRPKPQEIKPDTSQSIRWEDVAGADEAKEELREVVEFLRNPKRCKKPGAKLPPGILLHGPPGTGKTLLAKAVANESKAKFFAQSAASFVDMFAGLR